MKSLLRHRSYLRKLTPAQRRAWFTQWRTARPRVMIGSAYLPPTVAKSFAYVTLQ